MKSCTRCKTSKNLEEFGAYQSRGKTLIYSWCRPCMNQKCKEWAVANPERATGNRLRKRYWQHLTWQEALVKYMELLEKQDGKCAICKHPDSNKRLAVDHCHASRKVRGLLCGNCNQALGKLKDSEDLLVSAITYLKANA